MTEECTFRVNLREFNAVDLKTRHRFKEQLKVYTLFDDIKNKSERQTVGGGDVKWNFSASFDYTIYSYNFLDEKLFKVEVKCQHDKKVSLGHCSVDLYTCATGPAEHNLPLVDFEGKVVGRVHFILEMEQVTNVAAIFKEVKVNGLRPQEGHTSLNPYLKYAFSVDWPKIQEGSLTTKAVYSSVEHGENPVWHDLPELRFKASLKEMLHESIVLHITNHGKMHNHTLGRCNLLFRTVVDNGKPFKEENLITFKGSLKQDNATIEGTLYFKYIPRFAQMKAASVLRKPVHSEKGIHDAMPLLPGLPVPKLPLLNEGGSGTHVDDSVVKKKSTGNDLFNQKLKEMEDNQKKEKSESKVEATPVKKEDPAPLISFDSPVTPRGRSATVSGAKPSALPHMSVRDLSGFDSTRNFAFNPNPGFGPTPNPFAPFPAQQQQTAFNPFGGQQAFAFGGTPVAMQTNPQPQQPNPFAQQPAQQQTNQQPSFNPFA